MINIVILGNCQVEALHKFLAGFLDPSLYNVQWIVSFQNLDNWEECKSLLATADILVAQPISNYPNFSIDNLRKTAKSTCQIIRLPFIRFNGFWGKDERMLSKFAREAVMFFPDLRSIGEIPEFLADSSADKATIVDTFEEALAKLELIEKQSDVPFVQFVKDNFRAIPLFRDPWHPTSSLTRYVLEQSKRTILEVIGLDASNRVDLSPRPVGKEFGHYRPIQDSYANYLGLQYDTSSYYICSRHTYLSRIMAYEGSEGAAFVADMDSLKLLLLEESF